MQSLFWFPALFTFRQFLFPCFLYSEAIFLLVPCFLHSGNHSSGSLRSSLSGNLCFPVFFTQRQSLFWFPAFFTQAISLLVPCFLHSSNLSYAFPAFFTVDMETSGVMKQLPWTTAKLVPEALKHRLHVVEDPTPISLLGRKKFVDLVVFGAAGWQLGVRHFNSSCFFSTG
jgi:hypothetical protein